MAKFRVGDEVKLGGGCARVIHIESTGDFPYLVERADNRIEFCNDAELYPLLPAIPAGWTPASDPPDSDRNVRVVLKDGREWYGWYGDLKKLWHVYTKDASVKFITEYPKVYYAKIRDAAPGEVLAWCEIEPAAKARYVVVAIPALYDTLEEAELHALRAMESLRVNVVIARVVEEVNRASRLSRSWRSREWTSSRSLTS